MKSFKEFLKETPPTNWTNSTSTVPGFSSSAEAPVAGYDPKLFKDPVTDDLLSQDYQTPGQSGLAKWRFSTIWPVSHLTMSGIDDMVTASNKYVNMMDKRTLERIHSNLSKFYEDTEMKKKFNSFIEEASSKRCPEGEYYCHEKKKCMPIPKGKYVGPGGWLRTGHSHSHNGSNNGNGNGNGNGSNGNGGNGNGGGGNGGGGE